MRTSLQKGEKVLLVTHGSWTALIIPIFIAVAGIVGSFFIGFTERYGWIAAVVGLLYLLIRYAIWNANIWVVTNFRVIDEVGLLNHFAKESPLDKINNVSYNRSILGRIFNYGDVEIQTAAQVGATTYFNVNHPKRLQETIAAAQAEYKNWEYGNQAKQMAAAIGGQVGGANAPQVAAELEKLFELKMKGAISEEEYIRAKSRLLNH
ncbi:MAG: PH domain-containing protein [Bacteroidetes bacterium]|nr:PH domain-containing protein [Bacteroidota bacterium]